MELVLVFPDVSPISTISITFCKYKPLPLLTSGKGDRCPCVPPGPSLASGHQCLEVQRLAGRQELAATPTAQQVTGSPGHCYPSLLSFLSPSLPARESKFHLGQVDVSRQGPVQRAPAGVQQRTPRTGRGRKAAATAESPYSPRDGSQQRHFTLL